MNTLMRAAFHGYYRLPNEEVKTLWKECIFILDANVLLDLHRFPIDVRRQLLAALGRVRSRVWVPYQAALEYQDNWSTVVYEQAGRYDKVRDVVTRSKTSLTNEIMNLQLEKRHSVISPRAFIVELERAVDKFLRHIEVLKARHDHTADESLRKSVEALVGDNVGPPPESQAALDKLYKEGLIRFENKLPPGYRDASKEGKAEAPLMHGGLLYQRKFGDLLMWHQILDHAKLTKPKGVILVTNDEKPDWWLIEHGSKVGPRRELLEEFRRVSEVQLFHMYNTQSFLENAVRHLGVRVDQVSIEKVRDILEARRAVPQLTHRQILEAFSVFNKTLRDTPKWKGFPDSTRHNRHKYAIRNDGLLYPVKKIISLAGDLSVTQFSGGAQANRRIEEAGFEIVPISPGLGSDEADEDSEEDPTP